MRTKHMKAPLKGADGRSPTRSTISDAHLKFLANFPLENPNPILCINKKGILLFINSAGSFLFSGMKMFLNKSVDAEWQKIVKNAFSKGDNLTIRRNIKKRLFEFDIFPVKKMGYVNIYGRDITKQRSFEEDLELKANLLENSTESIFLHDEHGKFYYVNEAAYKSRGYTKEEIMKMSLDNLNIPEFKRVVSLRINEIKKTGAAVFESTQHRKDGSVMPVEVHVRTILIGNKIYYLATIMDITKRKLEHERLQKTLREMQAQMLISAFTSGLVHEIRNPLTTIKGFFDIWKSKIVNEKTKAKLETMAVKEVIRIEHLLTSLLNYAKPSAKLYHFSKLSGVINAAVNLGAIEATKRHIKILSLPDKRDCKVKMDPQQMEGVFLNIIMNAIQAMSVGGKLVISTRSDLKESNIYVIFRDNGCGMTKKILTQIYKPFFTTKNNGTGLGLMISRRIVQEHGGSMNVKSISGKGTTVTVTLPTAEKKQKG